VPDEFRWGWDLKRGNCGIDPWCWGRRFPPNEDIELHFCDGVKESYGIYSNARGRMLIGEREIKADPDFNSLYTTCPALGNPHLVIIPWIVYFKVDRTTCVQKTTVIPGYPGVPGYFIEGESSPSLGESFGTAFAYASYFEFIVTVLAIQSLIMCGCVKTAPKVFSA